MSEQQPNALRLAEMFNSGRYDNGTAILAARELRRLHAAEVGSTAELLRRQNMIYLLEGLVMSLRAELSRLQAERDQWMNLAKSGISTMQARIDELKARHEKWKRRIADTRHKFMKKAKPAAPALVPLTKAQMEAGRDQIFSINNPYCPCDSKTFRKVAEWVERHHGINGLTVGDGGAKG